MICVLGGMGFIGRHTVRTLLSHGHKVRIFDRTIPNKVQIEAIFGKTDAIDFVEGNFTNQLDIAKALEGCDTCIHLVTTTLPASSNEDKIYDVQSNLIGTLNILETMRSLNIKKHVFLSSGGTIYGNPIYSPLDEAHPANPISSYGVVKLAVEKYCYLFNQLYGLKTVVLRVSNPYGFGQSNGRIQGVIPVFLNKALSGHPIEIWGDGNVVRDYIHISDVSNAILSAINYDGAEQVFNVGSGTGTSLNQIINCISTSLKRKISVNYHPSRSLDVSSNILNIEKAQSELGWMPSMDLNSGINNLVSEMKKLD